MTIVEVVFMVAVILLVWWVCELNSTAEARRILLLRQNRLLEVFRTRNRILNNNLRVNRACFQKVQLRNAELRKEIESKKALSDICAAVRASRVKRKTK